MRDCNGENIIVLNGDILEKVDFNEMMNQHKNSKCSITIAVKKMYQYERFGTVDIENGKIVNFEEKRYMDEGYINVGCYIINKNIFENKIKEEKFSFETDYLEKYVKTCNMNPYIYKDIFIDIGIPSDYEKAKEYMKNI